MQSKELIKSTLKNTTEATTLDSSAKLRNVYRAFFMRTMESLTNACNS